jgi:hypothetical protein
VSTDPIFGKQTSPPSCGTGVAGLFDCRAIAVFPQKNEAGDKRKLTKVDLTLCSLM